MQKRKMWIAKRKKEHQPLLQRSLEHLEGHHNSLLNQTPEIGIEGLIAMIDSKRELQKHLKKKTMKNRRKLHAGNH